MKLNSIRKIDLKKCVAYIEKLIRIIESYEKEQLRSVDEIALIQYIKTQNQKDAAQYMNDQGHQVKTDSRFTTKKYEAKEISELIKAPYNEINARESIHCMARQIYCFNKGEKGYKALINEIERMEKRMGF